MIKNLDVSVDTASNLKVSSKIETIIEQLSEQRGNFL